MSDEGEPPGRWRFRPATPADRDALIRLEQACFPEDAFSRRQIAYYFRHSLPAGNLRIVLAVTPADDMIGNIYLCTPQRHRTARLFSIAVRPDWRRCGLGASLMTEAERQARALGYTGIHAETRVENTASQTLLRRRGWRKIGALPDYYDRGADGVKWRLELSERITIRLNE